ncbi:complement factor H [Athene noctua]|uniref:complement factor H n=1 Tax=Athene noctua TaxID=126797 RepID=UPI003EBEF142
MSFLGYTALFLCWIYCTAERACQEPPPRRVKEVPTERWDKPPYPHGTQVTYRCRPGYIKLGRIAFECADGVWEQRLPAIECRNKPCGHPGDIEFGSFELTSGTEFVFGARVEYRCNDGYWMLSQRNYRECQADGWSNDVPHCEVAKCLPIQAPENGKIIITGAFELGREYSFGQVVNFECNAKHRLVGSKEIMCSSNGKWSSDVPQCQEIICDVPKIPHGFIRSPKGSYKEYEQLHYACDEGYRHGERADTQCTESGWNPIPYCTEIVCSPPIIRNGNFRPQEDNYVVGDIITVQCNTGYHFKTLTGKNTAECTRDGWVPDPGCVQKPCDYPAIENGKLSDSLEYHKNYYFPMRVGQHADYHCANGYSTPSGHYWVRIACSGRGWSPEPKCLKICHTRQLENGYFSQRWKSSYKEGESVKYVCDTDYLTEHEGGEVTCTKDGWSPPPRCIRKKKCQNINFENGFFTLRKTTFNLQEKVTYNCITGFVTPEGQETGVIQCQENGWTPPPKCIKSCKTSHLDILIYHTNKTMFMPGDTIEYACLEGYQTADKMPTGTTRCGINGEWSPTPQCLAIECEMLELPNGDFSPKEGKYRNGHVVKFTCANNYVRVGPASTQCYYFGWFPSPPVCKDPSPQCVLPVDVELVQNGQLPKPKKKTGFNKVIRYMCTSADRNVKQATCVSGKWSPEIECSAEESACPPPPQLPDAQQISVGRNYKNGSKISFSCLNGFQLIGVNEITCIEGKWQSPPYCVERPCLPPQPVECADVPRLENANLKVNREGKTFYLSGAKFKYVSRPGYKFNGLSEITCSKGNWTPAPACFEMPCESIPKVANAQTEGRNKEIYEPGETVHYQCDAGFLIVGPPEIICREGNWTAPPFCEDVSCGAAPEIPNAYITSTQQERYLPGARLQYECESNFQMMGGNYVTCTNGEWSQAPTCRDVTCEPPPEIAGGKVEGVKKSRYLPGESAHYQCWQGFVMAGDSTIVCQNGTWTKLPKCKGKGGKCGPPPVIENGDLLSFPVQEYPQGSTLEYKCPSLYVLEGSRHITCTDGQWTSPPVCLVACTASEENMVRNNIELKWVTARKLYSRSGDFIEFRCKRGYMEDPASPPFRAQCIKGTLEYPQCKPGKNCTVHKRIMERNNIQLQSSSWLSTSTYHTGDYILFECKRWYREVSHPEKFRAECRDGAITYPTCE